MYTPPETDVSYKKNGFCGINYDKNKTKKRIALMVNELCTTHGVGTVVSTLVTDLVNYYDVYIINLWRDGDLAYTFPSEVKFHSVWQSKKRLRHAFFSTVIELSRYLEDEKIDVLIIHGRGNNIYPFFVKMLIDIKIVHVEHFSLNAYNFIMKSFKDRVLGYYLHSWLIKLFSDYVVTLTKKEQDFYKGYKVPHSYIYNPLNDALLISSPPYAVEAKAIITCGRIDFQKGYEYLIEVAKKVLEVHPDWRWDIYGDAVGTGKAYLKQLKERIYQCGLENKVNFMGNHKNIYDIYSKYSFYVMTSRWEGFGMVLIEAKAKGLPIISFDIYSGPSDIVRDGVDGYLIPPFDVNEMASKINFLIENPITRKKLAANSRGNLEEFRKERILIKWKKLIDRL